MIEILKKIATVALLMIMCASNVSAEALLTMDSKVDLLKNLNIISGYSDGTMRLENPVSRAEFTKIAVAASQYRNFAAVNTSVSPFEDVSFRHWAAPYILLAVKEGLVSGYKDATFRPDNTVTYEEALTVALRILGYGEDDFGSSWPYGQIGIAQKIGLTEGLDCSVGQEMTRGDVVKLVYNMLTANAKGSSEEYIKSLNYSIAEDSIIIATANEDPSVGAGKVYTSTGTYKIGDGFDYGFVGRKGDIVLKNSDEFVSFIPNEQIVKEYIVRQVLGENVIVSDNGILTKLDVGKSLTVYNKSVKTTLESLMSSLSIGDVILTYTNSNGVLDYGFVQTNKLTGPVTVKSSNWREQLGITGDGLTIIRDGIKAQESSIAINDIIYYSSALNSVWAYSKKVTGIYESASPNKDTPTSVTVSGVSYSIESAVAYNALSSAGTFNYGDTVTLLLGKNGRIADVIPAEQNSKSIYGFLKATGKKEFTDSDGDKYSSYYIDVVLPDGTESEYAADKSYENMQNSVVEITFSKGVAKVTPCSGKTDLTGTVDADNCKIGSEKVAPNVNILDVSYSDKYKTASYTTVFLQRLDNVNISGKVLYWSKNENGQIDTLILHDVTGDTYKYGIVTEAEYVKGSVSGKYTFDIGGSSQTVSTNGTKFNIESGECARFTYSGSELINISPLEKIDETITGLESTYIKTSKGNRYLLSSSVIVYKKTSDYKYFVIPLGNAVGRDDLNILAFYDKSESSGGRIRVIVVSER